MKQPELYHGAYAHMIEMTDDEEYDDMLDGMDDIVSSWDDLLPTSQNTIDTLE